MKKRKFRYHKIGPLIKQLVSDVKPAPERLNMRINIERISRKNIEKFCVGRNDLTAYEKMHKHELVCEPVEKIIVIRQASGEKIEKRYLVKMLQDLGYNVNVLFGKNHGCDFDAAVNVNGYSMPGWGGCKNFSFDK